jgi:hypothetical protein
VELLDWPCVSFVIGDLAAGFFQNFRNNGCVFQGRKASLKLRHEITQHALDVRAEGLPALVEEIRFRDVLHAVALLQTLQRVGGQQQSGCRQYTTFRILCLRL